ncbi:hypothetical protein AVEN_215437-1 [Araneus ventricosus]|uniref:Tc1-like transposase DDE domain-containing protein n=1 Tax=Araneus ventricosus TaxID=182803 RepID=A0A4Y2N780_ARAVE|nr:hypothetical protein AVEN_215437-1 [Araneus ventricosus]
MSRQDIGKRCLSFESDKEAARASHHTVHQTEDLMRSFKWEVWCHPPYRSDLAPSNYFPFSPDCFWVSGVVRLLSWGFGVLSLPVWAR